MSGTLRSAILRYVGLQQDTSIYELQSAQFANKYFIISGEGSRRLMASPEVVGFDSYRSLLGETVDALRFLFPSGGDVDIMTILRGGLNYPIEEACFRSGVRGNLCRHPCKKDIPLCADSYRKPPELSSWRRCPWRWRFRHKTLLEKRNYFEKALLEK